MFKNKNKESQKGFTLIELLVVIAIIGVMAGAVIVNLSGANQRSRDSRRQGDLKQIQSALEMFYFDNAYYPTAATTTPVEEVLTDPYFTENAFRGGLPTDPRNTGDYVYTYEGDEDGYTITANLEGDEEPYILFNLN